MSEDDAEEELMWSPRPASTSAASPASSQPKQQPQQAFTPTPKKNTFSSLDDEVEENGMVLWQSPAQKSNTFASPSPAHRKTPFSSPAAAAGHPGVLAQELQTIQGTYPQPDTVSSVRVRGSCAQKFMKATQRLLHQIQNRGGRGRGRGRGRGHPKARASQMPPGIQASQQPPQASASSRDRQSEELPPQTGRARAPRGTVGTFAGYKRPAGQEERQQFDMIREAYDSWKQSAVDHHEVVMTGIQCFI